MTASCSQASHAATEGAKTTTLSMRSAPAFPTGIRPACVPCASRSPQLSIYGSIVRLPRWTTLRRSAGIQG
ncbi:hypothetical protein [Streptomyces noursei]|uniref:Uncharacterized protein n=1 Tax=Streptomyces noursei TaxID=1971 RepID=A0A2N8P7Y9_STRNR|nr:hypothetical protein [Streptomyces noursei]PNE37132.1 hypothetical protein AOB60_22270 [Streptomyces noursei]